MRKYNLAAPKSKEENDINVNSRERGYWIFWLGIINIFYLLREKVFILHLI